MSTTSSPPRFVPTLTDVVARPHSAYTVFGSGAVAVEYAVSSDEQLLERIMQRVDVVLERRLREALGKVILESTQQLLPRLREEIEGLVKESIVQALSQEPSQR
jgi:hypothetical protein